MKKIAKKALALFCAISMLFSLTVAVQAGTVAPTITVGSVNAEPGTEVTVPVSISDNAASGDPDFPGLTGLTLNFQYDADVLKYKSAVVGEALPGLDLTKPGKQYTEGDLTFNWDGTDSDNTEGEILLITFTVADNAPGGDHAIDVIVVTACDYWTEDVNTYVVSGAVKLPGGETSEKPEITTITVGSVADVNPGDEIEVPVTIAGNDNGDPDAPGITGLTLNFKYDPAVLKYASAAAGEALPGLDLTKPGKQYTEGDLTFNWDGTDADSTDGEILVITFTVLDTAKGGDHTVDLTVKTACDYWMADLETIAVDGTVSVIGGPEIPEITTVTVGGVTGAKPGDEIEVPVSIAGNDNGDPDAPGLTGLTLNFKYDANVLAYKSAEKGEALPGLDLTKPGKQYTEGDITFNWDGTDADATDGEILVITFTVKDTATGGDHTVDLTVVTACDYWMADLETIAVDGTVNIDAPAHEHSYTEEITTAPTHTTVGIKTFRCSCGDSYTAEIPANADDHSYEGVVTTAPTHTTAGVKTYTCICGDSYTEAIPANVDDHDYGEGVVTLEPTCADAGVKTFTCACGDSYTEEIPATEEHTPGEWEEHDEIGHKQICTVCETILFTEMHKLDEGVVTKNPTEIEEGIKTYTCTVCGYTREEAIPPLGHTHEMAFNEEVPATCGKAGTKAHYICSACGKVYVDKEGTQELADLVIPATGEHVYEGVETLAPTHTTDGVMTFTCSVCGDSYEEVIPAKADDHEYDDGVVTLEPTHTTTGIKTFTCICGDTYTEVIPANEDDHEYDDGVVTLEPTHTTTGIKTYTCICGDTYTEEIPANVDDHEYDDGVVTLEPTHTEAGIKTYTCICGDTYTEEIPANVDDHEYEGRVTKEATHTEDGIKTYTCICGDSYEEVIPAKVDDHEYDEGVVTLEPTHTTTGIKTYTCICGDTYTEEIPANVDAHEYGDWAPYGDEYHQKKCECGEFVTEEHTWDDGQVVINPTATEDGVKLYTCTACGRFKAESIPAGSTGGSTTGGSTTGGSTTGGSTTGGSTTGGSTTGGSTTGGSTTGGTTTGGSETVECPHYWNYDVTTEPGCEPGVMTYVCLVCGETYTEEIPAIGHVYGDWEKDDAENHKKVCICGDVITEAHAWDEGVVATPATETTAGVKVYTCTVCGQTKLEVIPATGTGDSTTGGSTTGGSTTGGSTTGGSTTGGSTTGGSTTGGSTTGGSTTGGSTTGGSTTGGSTTGGSTTGGSTTGGSTTGGSTTGGSTTGGSTTGGSTTGGTTTGGGETDDPCETGHTWDEGVVTTPATCSTEGIKTFTCTVCGEATYTEVIPATGEHAWDEGVVTVEPTITEDGVKTYTCTVCGETKTEAVEKLGPTSITVGSMAANEGDTITVPVVLAKNYAGLCGLTLKFTYDARVLSYISAVKGEALPDLDLTKPGSAFTEGDLTFNWDGTDSDFTAGEILLITFRLADSLVSGDYTINVDVLTACDFDFNDIDVETVAGTISVTGTAQPPHEHEYGDWAKVDDNNHAKTCACGDVVTEAHTWDEGVVTTPATCTEAGVKTYTCTVCGGTKTEAIEATGHTWDEGVITTPATCTEAGVKTYTCTVCGETKTEAIEATGHTYGDWAKVDDDNHAKTCACGDVVTEAHTWDEGVVTTPATCTEAGVKTYTCTVCGGTKTEAIEATGHTYGDWAQVDDDNHAKTCACGDVVTEAHTWDEGVVTVEPTRYATGIKTYTCTVCGGTKEEVLPKVSGGSMGGGSSSGRPSITEPKDPVDVPKDPTEDPKDPIDADITDFDDVKESDWFYPAVEFAVNNNLMAGISDDKFDPYMNTTRGMVITVLYRLEGSPAVSGTPTFADVNPNAYYYDAVIWGQQNGIIAGFSETEYGPDINVTREQLVAIMHRYAEFKGYDVSHGEDVGLHTYDDDHHVSDWAEESVKYGVGLGLIYGRSETTINPLDNAIRAEFAAIMQRFIEKHN